MIAKWVLKMWIIINKRHFVIFLDNCTQEYKATKKQIVRLQLNEKKSKKSQTRLMSWYWKQKLTWSKDLITCNSHLWIMFFFFLINWLSFGEEVGSFEVGRPKSRGWTRGRGILKIGQFFWTSYVYHPLKILFCSFSII